MPILLPNIPALHIKGYAVVAALGADATRDERDADKKSYDTDSFMD